MLHIDSDRRRPRVPARPGYPSSLEEEEAWSCLAGHQEPWWSLTSQTKPEDNPVETEEASINEAASFEEAGKPLQSLQRPLLPSGPVPHECRMAQSLNRVWTRAALNCVAQEVGIQPGVGSHGHFWHVRGSQEPSVRQSPSIRGLLPRCPQETEPMNSRQDREREQASTRPEGGEWPPGRGRQLLQWECYTQLSSVETRWLTFLRSHDGSLKLQPFLSQEEKMEPAAELRSSGSAEGSQDLTCTPGSLPVVQVPRERRKGLGSEPPLYLTRRRWGWSGRNGGRAWRELLLLRASPKKRELFGIPLGLVGRPLAQEEAQLGGMDRRQGGLCLRHTCSEVVPQCKLCVGQVLAEFFKFGLTAFFF